MSLTVLKCCEVSGSLIQFHGSIAWWQVGQGKDLSTFHITEYIFQYGYGIMFPHKYLVQLVTVYTYSLWAIFFLGSTNWLTHSVSFSTGLMTLTMVSFCSSWFSWGCSETDTVWSAIFTRIAFGFNFCVVPINSLSLSSNGSLNSAASWRKFFFFIFSRPICRLAWRPSRGWQCS